MMGVYPGAWFAFADGITAWHALMEVSCRPYGHTHLVPWYFFLEHTPPKGPTDRVHGCNVPSSRWVGRGGGEKGVLRAAVVPAMARRTETVAAVIAHQRALVFGPHESAS